MSAVLSHPSIKQAASHRLAIVPPSPAFAVITEHATIRTAPHSKLFRSKFQVRSKESGDVSELAALIRSQGLLQNLVGYEEVSDGVLTGQIGVVAGGRRLKAIGLLISCGDLPEDFQIPYLLVSEGEAIAISLAENSGREPMHAADVFDAMLELSKRGASVDDIALAFGLDALTVKRRLKLANVSPRLVALYRKEEVSFDQMMALAISDSHTTQEQVWDSLDKWSRHPHQLRKLLTAQQINVETDKVARFVGVDAFEKAGGTITRDLFSDSGAGYISDAALLESLAAAKLAKAAAKLDKEGFAWVDVRVRVDRSDLTDYAKLRTTCRKQTDEEQTALAALGAELDKLEDEIDAAHETEDGNPDPLYERQEVLEAKQTMILQGLVQPDPADKLIAGALVSIDDSGRPVIYRDLIRPDDKSKMAKIGNASGADTSDEKAPKLKPVHSDRLTGVLTAHRTIALQAEMMNRPDVAFVVLTERLIKQVFFPHDFHEKITQISLQHPTLAKDVQSGSASIAFEAKRETLLAQLPQDSDTLLAWLLEQPQATVFDYMAFCTACSLNAVQTREQASPVFIEIAKAVNLNMGNWWKPTAETYFNHVSKARMVDVVTQAVSVDAARPLDKLKKSPAADAAERSVALTSWLPEVLRT